MAFACFEYGGREHKPRNAGRSQDLEKEKKRFFPGPSRRKQLSCYLDFNQQTHFRLPTSRTVRQYIMSFEATKFMIIS